MIDDDISGVLDDDILGAFATAGKSFAIGLFAGAVYAAIALAPIFIAETSTGRLIGLFWAIFVALFTMVCVLVWWHRWWQRAP